MNKKISFFIRLKTLGLLLFLVLTGGDLLAQVRVDLSFQRRIYIAYEPLIAKVTIENLSGQDLELRDTDDTKWFGFEIETPHGRLIPPRNINYSMPPVIVPSGQSIARAINLTTLYPIGEYGTYLVRASIFVPSLGRYFSSSPSRLEITEGDTLWRQRVGVANGPNTGETREISLLQFKLPHSLALYLRIEDPNQGIILCTHQLGRTVSRGSPDILLDAENEVHILQLAAPKKYLYTHAGLDGKIRDRKVYETDKSRPALKKAPEGLVHVVGGIYVDPEQQKSEAAPTNVTSRPVPIPTPIPKEPANKDQIPKIR